MTMQRFRSGPQAVGLEQIHTPGLGDHSYLLVADGEAVIVDPQRDLERFERALEAVGARLRAVLETHVHNDYVSGGAALAQRHDVPYVLPEESGASMPHRASGEGDELTLGGWRLRSLFTPGHTPQHLAYALVGDEGPVAVFSGGSLLVGAVGRSDLLGAELADELARLQYRSVQRLVRELPESTSVQPTHGAGSFCTSNAAGAASSTIGEERRTNPALLAPSERAFLAARQEGLRRFPAYYAHMAPLNRAGAPALVLGPLPRLDPAALEALRARHGEELWIVDLRDARTFAAGHLPGALNVPAGDDAGVYIGWIVPWGAPLALVTDGEHALAHARLQLARIGIEGLVGAITDGLAAWQEPRVPLARQRTATFAVLAHERGAVVLDVRDPLEARADALPGSLNIHVGELAARRAELSAGALWVHCASGYRAAIAASLLARLGREVVAVIDDFAAHRAAPREA